MYLDNVGSGYSTCSTGGCNFSTGGSIRLFTSNAFFTTEFTICVWVLTFDISTNYTYLAVQNSSNDNVNSRLFGKSGDGYL